MRVAICDDHDVVRDGIRWLLAERADIEIIAEADSSHGAIEILEAKDSPDVMLLDLRMGGTSGFDVLEAATRLVAPPPIVVMSMHDEPAHVKRALSLGAAGYVLKNSSRRELLHALDSAVNGGRYVQGDLAAMLVDEDMSVSITPREREIVALVADGAENKQIARHLGLSEETVKSYLKNLFARWDVSSRAEAVAMAIRLGVID